MKRITKEELPEVLTEDTIAILVEMAMESPKMTFDWRDISNYLSEYDYASLQIVLDEVQKRQKTIEQAKEDVKSKKQKEKEKEEWQEFVKNADPNGFYGNMGQPETPKEYKNRYGVWPPGYDKKGNKI
jgi:hypothetical protein